PDRAEKYDLLRREQREFDNDPTKGGVVSVLCEDVIGFDVQYLEPMTDTWLDAWDSSQATSTYTFNRLPLQVKIRLDLRGGEGDPRPPRFEPRVGVAVQPPLPSPPPKTQLQQTAKQKGNLSR